MLHLLVDSATPKSYKLLKNNIQKQRNLRKLHYLCKRYNASESYIKTI